MKFFQIEVYSLINNFLIPCIIACILGGIIGYQREKSDRPAGLRTNILVCLGSTVFTIVSYLGFGNTADVTRIAAGVVTGIGFIGAGVIFRQGPFLTGITTAATIWLVASIGVTVGAKLYYLAFIATALGFVILSVLKYLEYRLSKRGVYRLEIILNDELKDHTDIDKYLMKYSRNIVYEKTKACRTSADRKNRFILSIKLESTIADFPVKILNIINEIKGIENIEIN